MKSKAWCALALLACSLSANAEWIKYSEAGTGSEYFFDSSTIRKDGDKFLLWTLRSFKTYQSMDGRSYKSVKSQFELNCREDAYRAGHIVVYAEPMGSGEVVISDPAPASNPWLPIVPDTVTVDLKSAICKKR
jgi:hypothetical protein